MASAGGAIENALAAAFRRGWKDGRLVVGTDYVLEALTPRLGQLWTHLALVWPRMRVQLRAGPSGSVGPDASGAELDVASDADLQVAVVLREASWVARRRLRRSFGDAAPAWSNGVRAAARQALTDAHAVGVTYAHGTHLLFGLLSDERSRANALLAGLGVDAQRLLADISLAASAREEGQPYTAAAEVLRLFGALDSPRSPGRRALAAWLRGVLLRRKVSSPVVYAVEYESIRQAVRLGSATVGPVHLFAAVCSLDHQLQARGWRLSDLFAPRNEGFSLLRRWGVTYADVERTAAEGTELVGAADRGRPWRSQRSDPAFSRGAAAVIERAEKCAVDLGYRRAGTNDLLLALISEESGSVIRLLRDLRIDVDAFAREVGQLVGPP